MKRILMVAPQRREGTYFGGMGIFAENLLRNSNAFKKYDIQFDVFDYFSGYKSVKNMKGILKRIRMYFNYMRFKKLLFKTISLNEIDIVHYNTARRFLMVMDLFIIRSLVKKYNVKVYMQIHFAEYDKIMFKSNFLNKIIKNLIEKNLTKLILLSKLTKNEFINHAFQEELLEVKYNYHPYNIFEDKIHEKINVMLQRDHINLLFIGSIDNRKGVFDLLQMLTDMKDKESYVLNICGGATEKRQEEKFDIKIREIENIIFHGYVNSIEKEQVYLSADILILPSYGEGLPLVILEAMSHGCAIYTTNVGAIPEVVNNDFGYLFVPGDMLDLENKLTYILDNRDKLADNMYNSYMESRKFNIDKYIEDICTIYWGEQDD